MKLTVNKEIFSKFAPLKIGVLVLENINNKVNINAVFDTEFAVIEENTKAKFEGIELAAYPIISCWREIYKSFGEKSARSSIEALIKRVKNDKGLYKINPLVDLYNLASLKFELPAGGENIDAIASDMELTFANGDEEFLPLGATAIEHPNAGEIVYKFGRIVVCRNFNYRESEITKLTEDTVRAVIVFEDVLGDDENLSAALDWTSNKVSSLLGAKAVKAVILNETENEVIL